MFVINHYNIKPGDIFVCIKGGHYDGHKYIEEAINAGASLIIGEEKRNIKNYKRVFNTKKYLSRKITKLNKKLSKNFHIIGITGTKGKTSTAVMTYQMLKSANYPVAYIGTLGLFYNNNIEKLNNTTPDALTLNKIFTKLHELGIKYIVMEVSSHALVEGRIQGLKFDVAGFTNLSQDHLDYHGNMKNYLNAKLRILKYLDGPLVVNADDDNSAVFIRKYKCYVSYGLEGMYKIKSFELYNNESLIHFTINYRNYSVVIPYVGSYNVYNYMHALCICTCLGLDIKEIINYTNNLKPIKGRNEVICKNNRYAVIDYAHSPKSVEEILKNYQNFVTGNIYTIIGCGGNRDKLKRPIMANIACEYSTKVILTSDNPRDEDPVDILSDMINGLNHSNYEVIENREQAIKKGVKLLKDNDYLLILGKGHEDYQIKNNIKYHFDDKEVLLKYFN